jgi:hypothetical protein
MYENRVHESENKHERRTVDCNGNLLQFLISTADKEGFYLDVSLCICDKFLKILLRLLCGATTPF